MQYALSMMPMHLPEKPLHQDVEEDIDLLMRADALGYSEVWIGEHFTSPDLYSWGGNGYTATTFPGRRGLAKDAGSTSIKRGASPASGWAATRRKATHLVCQQWTDMLRDASEDKPS